MFQQKSLLIRVLLDGSARAAGLCRVEGDIRVLAHWHLI